MECFLHVGPEKTGTTTIQEFLFINKEMLLENNFLFCSSTGVKNDTKLAVAAYSASRRDEFTTTIKLDSELKKYQDEIIFNLQAEIKACRKNVPDLKLIFSSEHIQARLTTLVELNRLKEIIFQLGVVKINVIVYLRRPSDVAQSLFSTALKCGNKLSEVPEPSQKYFNNACNHKRTIERLVHVFGLDNVNIKIFEKGELINGSVVDDFIEAMHLEKDKNYIFPVNKNESLSNLAVQVVCSINKLKEIDVPNSEIIKYVSGCFDGGKFLMSNQLHAKYENEFFESNEWVRTQYFPEKDTLFLPRKERVSAMGPVFSEEDVSRISAIIVTIVKRDKRVYSSKKMLMLYLKFVFFVKKIKISINRLINNG